MLSREVPQRGAVHFHYKKLGACKPERRQVHPHHLACIEEMERWVLSWGIHARAMPPRALAERIRNIATELAGRYGEI